MRITYRTLGKLIALMDENQLDCDLTVEIPTEQESECYAAELRIAGDTHDGGLDDDHPVIFVHCSTEKEQVRKSSMLAIAEEIGLLKDQNGKSLKLVRDVG